MKRCKVCRKKSRIERRVNNEGIVFCSKFLEGLFVSWDVYRKRSSVLLDILK